MNVVTPGLQKVWIAGVHGDSDYLLDITCLCACIKLAGFVVVRTKLFSNVTFKLFVIARVVFVIAEIVTKG